jgi:hypothetical protein
MDDAVSVDLAAGFAILGSEARQACEAVALRMASDPDLRARVDARHGQMAHAYTEGYPGTSLAAARQAGRRAYLFVLLIEAGRSTLTSSFP